MVLGRMVRSIRMQSFQTKPTATFAATVVGACLFLSKNHEKDCKNIENDASLSSFWSPTRCSNDNDSSNSSEQVQIHRLFSSASSPYVSTLPTTTKKSLLHNHILRIDNMLSPQECKILRNEADQLIRQGYGRDRIDEDDDSSYSSLSLRRISLEDMSPHAQSLSQKLLRERLLPLLFQSQPALLTDLGLSNWKDPKAIWEWASDEPTVNVYTKGGEFEAHRDGYALTVIVLLNEPSEFDGGGTKFFDTSNSTVEETHNAPPSVTVQPDSAGTAICFDGDMMHAGSPVLAGKRYVFVVSFSISSPQA